MSASATPLRRQLIRMVLVTSSAVLLVTSSSFFAYELLTFRQTSLQQLNTLGEAIANNSTAALAFDNSDDAESVLAAFEADPHIVGAALYDRRGALFAVYPTGTPASAFPDRPEVEASHRFEHGHLIGFQPVVEGGRFLGTLFVKSDLKAIDERIRLYSGIVALVIGVSVLLAYVLSRRLQHRISGPILALAATATAVSTRRDYSARVGKSNTYELDQLTDAFNHMLEEVQQSEARLRAQLGHLSLLQHITRAIGDRQDLASIFNVVLQSLETNLPIDFGCVLRRDAATGQLYMNTIGAASRRLGDAIALRDDTALAIDANGLSGCIAGELLCVPDTRQVDTALARMLADGGLGSLVIAPLGADKACFGVLLAARSKLDAFSSADCDFLKQLSDHVALAAEQAQLYGALQQAYDDLRQTQHTVMQQERLRALGQMASGIAHDINNAISPVALYTESLLEREPNLSPRARSYLTTIQRAIDDVASTVARMREFYRQREPQLTLARVDLNGTVQQAIEFTHARWSDLPQKLGIAVELRTELHDGPAEVMAAEGELRDALTNLIFNAVDAMPEGGTLTLRTRRISDSSDGETHYCIEVSDTGVGMDEATRRRCLEPFFTTKGERGTGLGLAMVYGMIQRHSAELQIDSEPGKGTTFRLVFAGVIQSTDSTTRAPILSVNTQSLRILVIDDDPMLIQSLEDILAADGHVVAVANGGQAGIDQFVAARASGEPFSAVITDLGMPHVDGRRVAAAIKAASPRTPVIMLTGWGQRLVADNEIPPFVDRVLAKPPRLQELRLALAELTATAEATA